MYLASAPYPKSVYQFLDELESEMGCLFLGVDEQVYRRVLRNFSNVTRLKIIESEDVSFIRNLTITEQEGELDLLSLLFPDLYLILKNNLGVAHVERVATLFVEHLEGVVESFRSRAENSFKK